MNDTIDIRIQSNPKMMRLVRKTIDQASEMVGFSERDVHAVTLAVDEGCTNIIRHCYRGSKVGDIVIRIRMYEDRIEIALRDFGEAIDVGKLRDCVEKRRQELETAGPVRPGGLGVMLIHSVMDKVQYKSSPTAGTVLRLVKYLSVEREKKIAGKST